MTVTPAMWTYEYFPIIKTYDNSEVTSMNQFSFDSIEPKSTNYGLTRAQSKCTSNTIRSVAAGESIEAAST